MVEYGHSIADVAGRLGMTTHSLYAWIKRFGPESETHAAAAAEQAEVKRLKKELKRVADERDILKKPRRTLPVTTSDVRLYQAREQPLAGAVLV